MKRIPSLDGLRGVAAVAVMFFHFAYFFVPQAGLFEIVPFLNRAYHAVDLFFYLSGFVMAHVYGSSLASDRGAAWRPFAVARFARIYPLFALTLAATAIASMWVKISGISFSLRGYALQPFLLQQWAGGLTWNYPSWSISTEMEAYVVFVFAAGPLLSGRYPRLIAAGCVAVVAALSLLHHGNLNLFSGPSALARTLAEFSLGVLLYRAHEFDVPFLDVASGPLAVLLIVVGLMAGGDALVVSGLAFTTLWGVRARGPIGRLLNSSPAVALGNWSYSVYLWHAPIHFAIAGALMAVGHPVERLSPAIALVLALATALLVIGLSAATYQLFETPMRRFIGAVAAPRGSSSA